ncbi:hypothetical protein NEMBOFW57_000880 [Staphylotrichum longicolle]|uniref:SET domain-containing protein n=1 Tax=Staphylotrichum longicolle TaxID=669026 RepID=A0AAD4F0R1_9PEZI|nr:hypothetical protein NEMBOFW57_000880 [Staphylotrichum longicolle]
MLLTPRTSSALLLLLARPLLASSDLGHTEICGPGASLFSPGGPVCLTDSRDLGGEDSDQPICVFTDTSFAEGRGISLITAPQRANYLATSPAFAEPDTVKSINQDLNQTPPTKYEMREIPGKGMGLIATAHILRGDLIMANTASLMIDYRAFNELSKPQYTALQAHAVDHLPPLHRSLFLNLSAHTPSTSHLTHAELVDAIAATNGFDIDPDDDDADQHNSFFVIFPSIARMNHDCRPNAEYRFDHPTLSQSIHAARDIAPGEELTLSYINPLLSRAQRLAKLQRNWGFACGCPLCTVDDARARESDARIAQIAKLREELRDWGRGERSRACPEMAELLVGLYEMERLWGTMHEAYTLAALEYNAAGDPWTAVKYARMGVEWGIPMLGEGDEDVRELRRLAEDPWEHWSWERRLRERGENAA